PETSSASAILFAHRLGWPFQREHVTRQIVHLLIVQRKLRHDGAWGHRLRIMKMPQVPGPVRSGIADIRQVGAERSAFAMDTMTGRAAEAGVQRLPVCDSRIETRDGVEVPQGNPQKSEYDGKEHTAGDERHRPASRMPCGV